MVRVFTLLSLIAAISLMIGAVSPVAAQSRAVPEDSAEITLSFAPLVRDVAPSVVSIYATRMARQPVSSPLFSDPFFERFFGPGLQLGPAPPPQNALGSGVVVGAEGLIVTNHHVIRDADAITVILADRREFEAELILRDERTDLALLRVDTGGEPLPYLEPAGDEDLEVGDLVLAVGNPFGVGQTVTSGIVSALARTTAGITDYSFFIQTDAAINPGNSGGALVDMRGRLIGINTAIYSRTGGSLGIGFAIPAAMVRAVVASVDNGGRVIRPWLGVDGEVVTAAIARSLDLPFPGGVLVRAVHPESPALRADLRVGDVIVGVDTMPINDLEALDYHVATLSLDSRSVLTLYRDSRRIDVAFDVEPPPEVPPRSVTRLQGRHPLVGAVVANLSPALIEETGYRGSRRQGVVVLEVAPRSPASRLRLAPADVIVAIDGQPIDSVDDLDILNGAGRDRWRIAIQRGDRRMETTVDG
ncbi:MAG: Do family serine endopeptidase [Inquilinaceae bacterium]